MATSLASIIPGARSVDEIDQKWQADDYTVDPATVADRLDDLRRDPV